MGGPLGTERRECGLVLDVDVGTAARSTTVTAAWTASVSPKVATAATTTTATITSEFATSSTATASSTAAASATVSRVGSSVVLTVESDTFLLVLNILCLLGLAARANDEVLVFRTGEGLALWELLRGAFVGLADAQVATESQTLLRKLGHVLVVGLGLVLGLSWLLGGGSLGIGSVAESWVASSSIRCEAGLVLHFGVGNGVASLLVGPLGIAIFSTPALSCLLVMFSGSLLVAILAVFKYSQHTECRCGSDDHRGERLHGHVHLCHVHDRDHHRGTRVALCTGVSK